MSDIEKLRQDIKSDLTELKNDIKDTINNNNFAIRESIADKLKPIDQTLERYRNDHESHFKKIGVAETERAEIKTVISVIQLKQNDQEHEIKEIKQTVNGLDRRQTLDEGKGAGAENANQKWYQKYGAVLGLIGGISGIIGIIMIIKSSIGV